jgi:signal peptidase I
MQSTNHLGNHPSNYPRKPALAVLMSLVLPGFGQLYNGQANKAIYLFLAFALLLIPGIAFVALHLPAAWVLPAGIAGLLSTLALWGYSMVDAWRTARQQAIYTAQPWQVEGTYLLVFLLCNVLALPLLTRYVQAHQVASYHIPSGSMEPSILAGDVLFADKRYNCPGCQTAVQRGDVAIFVYPNNRTQHYIKRIIALPGDHVRIQGRQVLVNGQPLTLQEQATAQGWRVTEGLEGRTWQVQWATPDAALNADAAPFDATVPPGHALVLGDNRSHTVDTRQFGVVPLHDVVGKALQIWFSRSSADGVRWSRMGMTVD